MNCRFIAILLVLCLCIGLASTAFAAQATLENSVDMTRLVENGISLFKALEAGGKYDSVCNIAGTVGVGIMGWINSSALQLLKWCASADKGGDPDYCKSVLGDSLYNEVVNAPLAAGQENKDNLMPPWGYWGSRTFSSSEMAAVKTLLGSTVGINAQRGLAGVYIRRQAQHGWDAGVRTEAALLYYCSAENHYGEYGVSSFMNEVRSALGKTKSDTIDSLDEFHQGAVLANVNTLTYRTKVYKYLTETLGLDSGVQQNQSSHSKEDCPSANFTDVPGDGYWAHNYIDYVVSTGLLVGTSATEFSPDAVMNRAMVVTVLYRMSGEPAVSGECSFTDVPEDAYYENAVIWAKDNKIVYGTTDTTFSPDDAVTREMLVTILFRYSQFTENVSYTPTHKLTGFSDVNQVHSYAYNAMIWAVDRGCIQGDTNNSLNPCGEATRAQVAVILTNFCTN